MENIQDKSEFVLAGSGSDKSIEIEFADGIRQIPADVVEYFGIEELRQSATALKAVTFTAFLDGVHAKKRKDMLNNFQSGFIANHFGG